jgi:hypothetical protein
MKKLVFALFISCLVYATQAQNYWQQQINYNINVSLNEKAKSLTGTVSLEYINNSPDALSFIWFHIYPNAYKNDKTALYQQIINDKSRKEKLQENNWGSISGLNFTVGGKPAKTEAHPIHIDVIKLILPSPLAPKSKITIATPFTVVLPKYFSRSGYDGNQIMACQWYPKPAVYDADGWHEMPYLDMGEFFADNGSFNVNITLPTDFIVSASGQLTTATEANMYKKLGKFNATARTKENGKGFKPMLYKAAKKGTKTLNYKIDNVPDFAWFADKDFIIAYDTLKLNSGKIVDAYSFFHNKKESLWYQSIDYVEDATRFYSSQIGEYVYPIVQAVEGPKNNSSGGMEYPTVTIITSPDANPKSLDAVIAHEVGHNWFMCMLASNERMHTWQDEGLNTFYQFRYEANKYKDISSMGGGLPEEWRAKPADEFLDILYSAVGKMIPMEGAIETPAADFATSDSYGMVSYFKTAIWLDIIENKLGKDVFDKAMQAYFKTWLHKHPKPNDLKKAFEDASGSNIDELWALLNESGSLTKK